MGAIAVLFSAGIYLICEGINRCRHHSEIFCVQIPILFHDIRRIVDHDLNFCYCIPIRVVDSRGYHNIIPGREAVSRRIDDHRIAVAVPGGELPGCRVRRCPVYKFNMERIIPSPFKEKSCVQKKMKPIEIVIGILTPGIIELEGVGGRIGFVGDDDIRSFPRFLGVADLSIRLDMNNEMYCVPLDYQFSDIRGIDNR